MKKISLLIILALCVLNIRAQQRERFSLRIPAVTPVVENSLYSSVSLLDSRVNKTQNQFIIVEQAFSIELSSVLNSLITTSAQNRVLLFQLRDLSFEVDGNNGMSHIRATLYESLNSQYYFIGTLDTNVEIRDSKNVSAALQEEVSRALISFIAGKLTQPYIDNVPYTLEDVRHIDYTEKSALPLYKMSLYTDGVYYTYEGFADQQPAITKMEVKYKKNIPAEIRIENKSDGKFKKIDTESFYAVVLGGQAYISFNKKLWPLYMDNGDLFFDAEQNVSRVGFAPSFSIGIGSGGYRGGGIGLGVYNQSRKQIFTYKIDHLSGTFIPLNQ